MCKDTLQFLIATEAVQAELAKLRAHMAPQVPVWNLTLDAYTFV
jgi:hypothetical protein